MGFDVVFDSVGGANMSNSFEAAALDAQIATTVSLRELDLIPAHFKGRSVYVIFMLVPMLHDYKREAHGAILANLAEVIDAGELKPVLDDHDFKLAEVGNAYDRLTSGHAIGKVVISI